jgi:hypothetical protein
MVRLVIMVFYIMFCFTKAWYVMYIYLVGYVTLQSYNVIVVMLLCYTRLVYVWYMCMLCYVMLCYGVLLRCVVSIRLCFSHVVYHSVGSDREQGARSAKPLARGAR